MTLRIPTKLKRELQLVARIERRSLNAQCVYLLERFVNCDRAIALGSEANDRCFRQLEQELLSLADSDAMPASTSQPCEGCDADEEYYDAYVSQESQ